MSFRFLTAGESHGQALVSIVEGLPAGIPVHIDSIHNELSLRRMGFGRSSRMKMESDTVQILSGIRDGKTLGSPITFVIENKGSQNLSTLPVLSNPRPGHADLVGTLKFQHSDVRNTLERASARETAIRTAVGAICQNFLKNFDIEFLAYVTQIGNISIKNQKTPWARTSTIEKSLLFCPEKKAEEQMIRLIQKCQKNGDTLGGVFEVRVKGLPLGLGNFSQWDLRLDGRLAQAVMSIPAIKGVEIGSGFHTAQLLGSKAQDEIFYDSKNKKSFGTFRKTNFSGGLEGGVTSGEELILRAAMKPLSTILKKPLKTINIFTKNPAQALVQRTDTCAVPAAAIVAKNVVAIEIAKAFLEKFRGDSLKEIRNNYESYLKSVL